MRLNTAFVGLSVIVVGCGAQLVGVVTAPPAVASTSTGDYVVAAAGDIACDPSATTTVSTCQQTATASLLTSLNPDAVLPLGDTQYESGALTAYQQSYGPTWGQLLPSTHPVVGNHEYETAGASGYYTYFGSAAGDPTKGYYSWNLGNWHLIALNGECAQGPDIGCAAGSPQEQWLKSDLANHTGQCILAYWHEPRFTSGLAGSNTAYDAFWQDLYAAHADVVLNGHAHDYERFAPQTPSQAADPQNGLTEFVVGTGGVDLQNFNAPLPNEVIRQNTTFGVLKLTLHSASYDWQYVPVAGSTFSDSGTASCHASGSSSDTTPPSVPSGLAASSVTSSQVGLSWTASVDNTGGSGVAGYRVYRSDLSGPLNTSLVTGTSYTDTTVSPSTSYTYAVSAVDNAGNESAKSSAVTVTTPAAGSVTLTNSLEGGTAGTTITGANSGGISGNAFNGPAVGTGATLAYDSTTAAHGTLSAKIATGSTATNSYLRWSTALGTVPTVYTRQYLYLPALPATATRVLAAIGANGTDAALQLLPTGQLRSLNAGAAVLNTSTTVLPLNQWVRIETMITGSTTSGQVQVKIFLTPDGTTPDETLTSPLTNTAGAISDLRFGISGTAVANTTYWLDDLDATTTGYPGPAA